MRLMRRFVALLIVFFIMAPTISTNVQAEVVKELGKGFPDTEVFTPGEWFLGQTPANYDENKPPISLYKEEMVMLIVGMERQYIMI